MLALIRTGVFDSRPRRSAVPMAPNLALVPLPSRPTAPVPLISQSSAKPPRWNQSPSGAAYLMPMLVSPSTWRRPGTLAESLFAIASVEAYASKTPLPALKSEVPSEIVVPKWLTESLVEGMPPGVVAGHGNLVVQRKPPVYHSV